MDRDGTSPRWPPATTAHRRHVGHDIGEIVGFATPPGAPGSARLWKCGSPASGDPPRQEPAGPELRRNGPRLGAGHQLHPGPRPLLSNLADRNFVAGSAIAESLGAYVYAIDPGSFIARVSTGSCGHAAAARCHAVNGAISISGDRTTILGWRAVTPSSPCCGTSVYSVRSPRSRADTAARPARKGRGVGGGDEPGCLDQRGLPAGRQRRGLVRTGLTPLADRAQRGNLRVTDSGKAYGTNAQAASHLAATQVTEAPLSRLPPQARAIALAGERESIPHSRRGREQRTGDQGDGRPPVRRRQFADVAAVGQTSTSSFTT